MKLKDNRGVGSAHNSIAFGTILKGVIQAEEDFRIDGKLEGDINCNGKVIVGPQAEIIGNIHCYNADLMGRITGQVLVQETICLKSTVNLQGEITARYVEIESGATFNGSCKMLNDSHD